MADNKINSEVRDVMDTKKKNEKIKLIAFLGAAVIIAIVSLLVIFSGEDANKESPAVVMTSRDLEAQKEELRKSKQIELKAESQLGDKIFNEIDPNGKKKEDILNSLVKENEMDEIFSELNNEGNEEKKEGDKEFQNSSDPGGSLLGDIKIEDGGNRKLFKPGNYDSIQKMERDKKEYELEKKTMFVYSRTYRNAEYLDIDEKKEKKAISSESEELSGGGKNGGKFGNGGTVGKGGTVGNEGIKREDVNSTIGGGKTPGNFLIYNGIPPVKICGGEFINAVLIHKLVCDENESPLVVRVYEDLYDDNGKYVLIPTGTKILGKSQKVNRDGVSRLYVWFERMILPNQVALHFPSSGRMSGMDSQGILGIRSNVDHHFIKKYGSAIFFGILNGLGGLAQTRTPADSIWIGGIDKTSRNFENLNGKIFDRYQNLVPTINVDPGYKLMIYVSEDILISPYSFISDRSYVRISGTEKKRTRRKQRIIDTRNTGETNEREN